MTWETEVLREKPVPVSARSKAWVCGRSFVETVGSNPTGGINVCKFNIHGSMHRSNLVAITNKMQLGNGIYYSTLH